MGENQKRHTTAVWLHACGWSPMDATIGTRGHRGFEAGSKSEADIWRWVMSQSGKGDRQRPVDKDQYDKNYESIIWEKKDESK